MNFSDVVSKAFRTLKSGTLWGFLATTYAAVAAVLVAAAVVVVVVLGSSLAHVASTLATTTPATMSSSDVLPLLVLGFVAVGLVLVLVPLGIVQYGGLIRLSDEVQAGRPVRIGDGWSFGFRRFGRIVAVEIVVQLLVTGLLVAVFAPIIALTIVSIATRGNAGAIVGLVCGGMLLLLALVIGTMVVSGFEALAIRYAVIGDRTAGDALKSGWVAFRARFKNVFVMVLILIGFGILFSIAQSAINYGVQSIGYGSLAFSRPGLSSALALGRIAPLLLVIYMVEIAAGAVFRLFQVSLWTAFFRQMTGLELAPPRPGYIPPYGMSAGGPPADAGGFPPAAQPTGQQPAPAPEPGPPMAPIPPPAATQPPAPPRAPVQVQPTAPAQPASPQPPAPAEPTR